jgi:hypothetical protein
VKDDTLKDDAYKVGRDMHPLVFPVSRRHARLIYQW